MSNKLVDVSALAERRRVAIERLVPYEDVISNMTDDLIGGYKFIIETTDDGDYIVRAYEYLDKKGRASVETIGDDLRQVIADVHNALVERDGGGRELGEPDD